MYIAYKVFVALIIRSKIYFVFLTFVAHVNHENIDNENFHIYGSNIVICKVHPYISCEGLCTGAPTLLIL